MSKINLVIVSVIGIFTTLPALAKQSGCQAVQGRTGISSTFVSSSSRQNAKQAKLSLPSTPLGSTVGSAGDYLVRQPIQSRVKQGHGLAGLPDTAIGPAVGMAGDHLSAQRKASSAPSRNSLGLEQARLGSIVGLAGDRMRSDLPNNGYRPYPRFASSLQIVRTKPVLESENRAASYADYNDTGKRKY